jgi:tRNA threonylcarbamoyladenosine biosynthesis protein TsaB
MIIAIDTASPAVSVALADGTGVVASLAVMRGRRHVETLIPAIEQLLAHAETSYNEVTAIAVDNGPGLFTGLRVGVATAKALALALNVPIIAVSSLTILAYECAKHHRNAELMCALDARRKEVYMQRFRVVDGVVNVVSNPACLSPNDALTTITDNENTIIVADSQLGSGSFPNYVLFDAFPKADVLARIATAPNAAQLAILPDHLELLYLRAPDVEINWTSRT